MMFYFTLIEFGEVLELVENVSPVFLLAFFEIAEPVIRYEIPDEYVRLVDGCMQVRNRYFFTIYIYDVHGVKV